MSYNLIIFLAIISIGYSEKIFTNHCTAAIDNYCTIHSLDLEPCELAENGNKCVIMAGSNITMHMSYTPVRENNEQRQFITAIAVTAGSLQNTPSESACEHTQCPLQPGQKHNYTMTFHIPETSLPGNNEISAYMTDGKDFVCCVKFKIAVIG